MSKKTREFQTRVRTVTAARAKIDGQTEPSNKPPVIATSIVENESTSVTTAADLAERAIVAELTDTSETGTEITAEPTEIQQIKEQLGALQAAFEEEKATRLTLQDEVTAERVTRHAMEERLSKLEQTIALLINKPDAREAQDATKPLPEETETISWDEMVEALCADVNRLREDLELKPIESRWVKAVLDHYGEYLTPTTVHEILCMKAWEACLFENGRAHIENPHLSISAIIRDQKQAIRHACPNIEEPETSVPRATMPVTRACTSLNIPRNLMLEVVSLQTLFSGLATTQTSLEGPKTFVELNNQVSKDIISVMPKYEAVVAGRQSGHGNEWQRIVSEAEMDEIHEFADTIQINLDHHGMGGGGMRSEPS